MNNCVFPGDLTSKMLALTLQLPVKKVLFECALKINQYLSHLYDKAFLKYHRIVNNNQFSHLLSLVLPLNCIC